MQSVKNTCKHVISKRTHAISKEHMQSVKNTCKHVISKEM